MARSLLLLALCLAVAPGCRSFRDCSTVDAAAAESLPERLSQTGLYADLAGDVVVDEAIAFAPRFPLWTDGATKRRWMVLPDGESVDTSAADDWQFPVGTKFFKEFTRDGVRVETRLNTRNADGWTAAAYIWNEAGDDAVRQIEAVEDVSGTLHDVPSTAQCLACHAGRGNFTLGFSATQLEPATRADLHAAGVLSDAVDAEPQLPDTALAGLGALHGNCSHCHNATRDDQPQATTCFAPPVDDDDDAFDLSLPPDLASVDAAPAVLTGRWQLGEIGDSEVLDRMSERNTREERPSMPPLGTELVDEEGLAAVEAFIAALPPREDRD